jgi:anaerobic ribonucleoside-triphosphate reductase activating protein
MTVLRVGRRLDRCRVLGPGNRAVIWVTGCHLRCRECMTPEFLDFHAGSDVTVAELRKWIGGLVEITGITFSGGEPFDQAPALNELVNLVLEDRPTLTTMAFTGYTVEQLRGGTSAQRQLVNRLDIIVDGPYLPERHSSARWRGSNNQRVHWRTARSLDAQAMSRSAGVEVLVDAHGGFAVAGVPPTRRFRRELRTRLAEQGITAKTGERA